MSVQSYLNFGIFPNILLQSFCDILKYLTSFFFGHFKIHCKTEQVTVDQSPKWINEMILPFNTYLMTDYFGTRQIVFGNNMNAVGNHFFYQVREQISCIYD